MLDHLNIQTENPCAILDQENAKLFLKGNPTEKYKFFLQSTDLYKMRTTYSKIDEDTRNISESVLKREKTKIATLAKAMKEAEERWEEAQSVRSAPLLLSMFVLSNVTILTLISLANIVSFIDRSDCWKRSSRA